MTVRGKVGNVTVVVIREVPTAPGARPGTEKVVIEAVRKGWLKEFGVLEPGCRAVVPKSWLKLV